MKLLFFLNFSKLNHFILLSGISNQRESGGSIEDELTSIQHQSVASRLAKIPTSNFGFLTKDEKQHVLNHSNGSDTTTSTNNNNSQGPPFSQIQSNKMPQRRMSTSKSEPSDSFIKSSLDSSLSKSHQFNNRSIEQENNENSSSQSNVFTYLSNIQPVKECRRKSNGATGSAV